MIGFFIRRECFDQEHNKQLDNFDKAQEAYADIEAHRTTDWAEEIDHLLNRRLSDERIAGVLIEYIYVGVIFFDVLCRERFA